MKKYVKLGLLFLTVCVTAATIAVREAQQEPLVQAGSLVLNLKEVQSVSNIHQVSNSDFTEYYIDFKNGDHLARWTLNRHIGQTEHDKLVAQYMRFQTHPVKFDKHHNVRLVGIFDLASATYIDTVRYVDHRDNTALPHEAGNYSFHVGTNASPNHYIAVINANEGTAKETREALVLALKRFYGE